MPVAEWCCKLKAPGRPVDTGEREAGGVAWTVFLLGKLAFAAVGVAVGARLAASVRRDWAGAGLGLHTVALAAIAFGGLGLAVAALAPVLESFGWAVAGEVGIRAGMLLLCVFIAGTFRPTAVGVVVALLCGVGLVGSIAWDIAAQPSLLDYDYTRASSHANQLSIGLPFAWVTGESALLCSRARRRLALGLAEPGIVRRYALWASATASFVGICGLAIAAGLADAAGAARAAAWAHGLRGLLYFVIVAAVWQGIFRPLSTGAEPSQDAAPA